MTIKNIFMGSSDDRSTGSLHGVRGLAVLLVLLSHASIHKIPPPFVGFDGAGKYGVYLFFCLSAFLLTAQLLSLPRERLSGAAWREFFFRRFIRVYPLYAIAVFCGLVFGLDFGQDSINPSSLFGYLSLTVVRGIFWTIPVEALYYCVIPPFVAAFVFTLDRDRNKGAAALAVLFAASAVYSLALPPHEVSTSLAAYLPLFFAGSFGALIHSEWMSTKTFTPAVRGLLDVAALSALLLFAVSVPSVLVRVVPGVDVHAYRLRWVWLFGVAWTAFILCQLHGSGVVRAVLETRFMKWTGKISYGAYLWHWPVYAFFSRTALSPSAKFAAAFVSVYVLSSASYVFIERPLSRIKAVVFEPARREEALAR